MNLEDQKLQDQIIVARSKLWTPELDKLLRKWTKQITLREKGHQSESRKYSRRHYIFGIPATLIGATVATGILSTFRNCDDCDDLSSPKCQIDVWIRLAAGLVALVSAALTAFQTFMNYQAEAKNHKDAADEYSALRREINSTLLIPGPYRGDPPTVLSGFRRNYDDLIRNSPSIPKKFEEDLTYKVKNWSDRRPRPPRPEDVKGMIGSTKDKLKPLHKLLKGTSEGTKEEDTSEDEKQEKPPMNKQGRLNQTLLNIRESLMKENEHNTSSDEDVCIGFDLDEVAYYDPTAWTSSPKRTAMQQAMQFEMERLNRHTLFDKETPPKTRHSRRKKRPSRSEQIEIVIEEPTSSTAE